MDDSACMCMLGMKCRIMCPMGMQLDPRESCHCVDDSVVEALSMCGHQDLLMTEDFDWPEPEIFSCGVGILGVEPVVVPKLSKRELRRQRKRDRRNRW